MRKVLPNWVDITNLIVLTITLGFIIWYVIATHRLTKAAQKQVQSLKKQSFENTFGRMYSRLLKKAQKTELYLVGHMYRVNDTRHTDIDYVRFTGV